MVGLNQMSLAGSSINLSNEPADNTAKQTLTVGDRVLVGGNKAGTLRFLGPTQFAKGEWAGVELDEAHGKNDGSVEGKRFEQYSIIRMDFI